MMQVSYLLLFVSTIVYQHHDVGAVFSNMEWEQVSSYPGPARHHPITFANETHAFVLTGSTDTNPLYSSDFYMYDELNDEWTDLSETTSAFPGVPRSFGYGVVLHTVPNHPKAYVGMGLGPSTEENGLPQPLNDLWEFDMTAHTWKQLATMPGNGRRHPAMNAVLANKNDNDAGGDSGSSSSSWEIHVGLGDDTTQNLNDWWIYDIDTDIWRQAPDLPAVARHHPFYFSLGSKSYAGLGHSDFGIERDWFRMENGQEWVLEPEFASYNLDDDQIVTTEARVAGTQFSIELGDENNSNNLKGSYGFVLSGDGDDHGTMLDGEFHYFDSTTGLWHPLPPHPGISRWAPGSWVMRGTARAYFTSGLDRMSQTSYNDVWKIDLSPLFMVKDDNTGNTEATTDAQIVNDATTASDAAAKNEDDGSSEAEQSGGGNEGVNTDADNGQQIVDNAPATSDSAKNGDAEIEADDLGNDQETDVGSTDTAVSSSVDGASSTSTAFRWNVVGSSLILLLTAHIFL